VHQRFSKFKQIPRSSILLILFLHSVNIYMIVTSLVSTHTTYRTLCFELMLSMVQNTMLGHACILSTPKDNGHISFFAL
jgi:hypothetical protein